MTLKRFLQSVLFLLPFFLGAQTYPFSNYGVKDGLSQSNVSGIVQDSSGYYWLATESGVSRFDGKNFVNYTTEDGLADNNVNTIFLDKNNKIWLGHANGGVTIYDGKQFKPIQSKAFAKDKKIYGFFQENSGALWICTSTNGVIKINDPTKAGEAQLKIHTYAAKEGLSQYVLSVMQDRQSNLWFLTDVGLKYKNKNSSEFEFFKADGMPSGQVTCIAPDRDRNLLIGTSNGSISRYNVDTKQFQALVTSESLNTPVNNSGVPNFIYTILEDKTGNIWASVFNYGVCRYNNATGVTIVFNTSNGLTANKIKSIYEDREGNLLFGTLGAGINVFSGEKFISFSSADGLVANSVRSICKDRNGHYWFGTNEGISIYDPSLTGIAAFKSLGMEDGLPSRVVSSIVSDKNGDIWIGTWAGKVAKYSLQQKQIVSVQGLNEIVNPYVNSLMVDKKNNLWIGTIEGIVKYDINTGAVKTIRTINGLSDNDVTAFCEDSKGQIWIGTKQKGITLFNGKTFKKLGRESGLTQGNVTSIAEDNTKHIWVGTQGGGAFVYNNQKFSSYKMKDGLISDFITLIVADGKNNIWLGTNKCLSKFDLTTKTFSSYDSDDGFTGVETVPNSSYYDDEGNIWFGTFNGVFEYNPKKDIPVSKQPILKLNGFRVNAIDYPISDEVTLSHLENSLHFNFIGISLSNPAGVTYKMKLDGYDKEWKPATSQDFEIYSNLQAKHYTFNLIACNSAGICSSALVMKIIITPPFWKTWWFYLLIFIVISAALFLYIKLRERKLRHEKKILEDKVNERTAEVVQKNIELDEKNKDITASIRYAKRIQDAILPPDDFVKKHLPNTFVLFKPKDIVSGDFYWMADKEDKVVFAAVDCTGHGVPGAFMSIVGHNLLDRIIIEQNILQPGLILDELNKGISDTLRQSDLEDNTVRDGMDIALCTFNRTTAMLEYAGAYNAMWLIREGKLIEFKANKFPIGTMRFDDNKKFTNHEIQLLKGDTVYIFSDGFSDQFGGPLGKKFKSNNFKQLLLDSIHLSMEEQGEVLDLAIQSWRGSHEQVDDILVIGTRL